MKIYVLVFISLIFSFLINAQSIYIIKKENGDCINAILIKDTIWGPANAPLDYGEQLEFSGNDKTDLLYIEEEHHTVWYKFYAKYTGELTFDIIPQSLDDDYDFMLFKYNDTSFCRKIKSKEVKPIRTNISRNDKKINGAIGLSVTAMAEYIHSGIGQSYSKAVSVQKGELYYLLIDNVYKNGAGHTIKFHYKQKLIKGQSLTFTNIQFESNSDIILPSSNTNLEKLLNIMQTNSSMKIEIQGHVNNPFIKDKVYERRDSIYDQNLSEKRAKAVRSYLIKNGIKENRLTYKGYGHSKMIYPKAKTGSEFQINRRVSVLILSL